MVKLKLKDDPKEWLQCFGLEDNPFSPIIERGGVELKPLELGSRHLCPQIRGQGALFDMFFVEDIDNVRGSFKKFRRYMERLAGDLLLRPPILLIHGPQGAGKSTFVNICRYVLANNLEPEPFQCELELAEFHRDGFRLDEIVSELIGQAARQLGNPAGADPRKFIAEHAAQVQDKLALVHLKGFSIELITSNDFERTEAFGFLSSLRRELLKHVKPLLFATASEVEVLNSFTNRPPGDATETQRYRLGELSGEDVVKVVGHRLEIFRARNQRPPEDLPLFPFTEDAILASFELSKEKESGNDPKEKTKGGERRQKGNGNGRKRKKKGSLPFRNVNTILSGALRTQLRDVLADNDVEAYRADLDRDELKRRVIDQDKLDSAVQDLFSE